MADYKIPNLCGASEKFNAIQSKFDTMIDNAIDGLEVDASALKATMDTDVTSLVSDLKALVPELPALPDVNLQGQLTSLAGLAAGSGAHNTLLADVTSKFGSALTAGGFSLDTLVSDAASAISGGTDLCSAVPNFSVPAAGGDAVQKAVEVLQAEEDSEKEKPSVQLANPNVTAASSSALSAFNKFFRKASETGTIPTEETETLTLSEKSTEIVVSSSGQGSTVPVLTDKDRTVTVDGKQEKKKVDTAEGVGHTSRPMIKSEEWLSPGYEKTFNPQRFQNGSSSINLLLKQPAIKILAVFEFITKVVEGDNTPDNWDKWKLATESSTPPLSTGKNQLFPVGHIVTQNEEVKVAMRKMEVSKNRYELKGKGNFISIELVEKVNGAALTARGGGFKSQDIWPHFRVAYTYNSNYDPN